VLAAQLDLGDDPPVCRRAARGLDRLARQTALHPHLGARLVPDDRGAGGQAIAQDLGLDLDGELAISAASSLPPLIA
jgi:hypothetical protein